LFNKYFVVVALLFFSQSLSWASDSDPLANRQNRIITGRITDAATGEPLAGAKVEAKGLSIATATNADGLYDLEISSGAEILMVSSIGYQTSEIQINGRSKIDITLASDERRVEEVIVVGYGTQSKEKVTGAVNQVGAEVFQNRPIVNLAQGLQGAIP